ncbi:MAG: hypothetical protein K2X66_00410, partial [Cyanobacteria bacterium]|nr:hypothetical protein [Cyanobacteriota bacterium]
MTTTLPGYAPSHLKVSASRYNPGEAVQGGKGIPQKLVFRGENDAPPKVWDTRYLKDLNKGWQEASYLDKMRLAGLTASNFLATTETGIAEQVLGSGGSTENKFLSDFLMDAPESFEIALQTIPNLSKSSGLLKYMFNITLSNRVLYALIREKNQDPTVFTKTHIPWLAPLAYVISQTTEPDSYSINLLKKSFKSFSPTSWCEILKKTAQELKHLGHSGLGQALKMTQFYSIPPEAIVDFILSEGSQHPLSEEDKKRVLEELRPIYPILGYEKKLKIQQLFQEWGYNSQGKKDSTPKKILFTQNIPEGLNKKTVQSIEQFFNEKARKSVSHQLYLFFKPEPGDSEELKWAFNQYEISQNRPFYQVHLGSGKDSKFPEAITAQIK